MRISDYIIFPDECQHGTAKKGKKVDELRSVAVRVAGYRSALKVRRRKCSR